MKSWTDYTYDDEGYPDGIDGSEDMMEFIVLGVRATGNGEDIGDNYRDLMNEFALGIIALRLADSTGLSLDDAFRAVDNIAEAGATVHYKVSANGEVEMSVAKDEPGENDLSVTVEVVS